MCVCEWLTYEYMNGWLGKQLTTFENMQHWWPPKRVLGTSIVTELNETSKSVKLKQNAWQSPRRDGIAVRVDIVVVGVVVVVAAVVGDLVVGVSGPAKENKNNTHDDRRAKFVSTKNIYIDGT